MKQKPYVKPKSNNRFFFLYSVKFFSEKNSNESKKGNGFLEQYLRHIGRV